MFKIEEEILGDNFDISNGILGVSKDTFLSLIGHMSFREESMLKNVSSLFYYLNLF
jgi:hypothetical protein